MKLSLAWIFDHLDADWHSIDKDHLMSLFNQKTAEIDGVKKICRDLDKLSAAQVLEKRVDGIVVYTPEWDLETVLQNREDIQISDWVLIHKNTIYRWATIEDMGGESTALLPAVYIDDTQPSHIWKNNLEKEDYILDIDNLSITNRPDLWGHRGVAREVAGFLNFSLKSIDDFVSYLDVSENTRAQAPQNNQPFEAIIKDQTGCSRLATLYVPEVKTKASDPKIMSRLCAIDVRPIDAIVDVTNYVMLDLGHPMHAFDADQLAKGAFVVRRAIAQEPLKLLDGRTIKLDVNDLVIANNNRALSLAGIMGGDSTGVTGATRSLFLEAACFDAATIRKTSQHHKLRTDASTRFEKQLDPHQPPITLARAHALLSQLEVIERDHKTMYVVGQLPSPTILEINHIFIEKRLGISIKPEFVIDILTRIGFLVEQKSDTYIVTVPSYRATKDIQQAIDIVEEIARFYGYNAIKPQLPAIVLKPSNIDEVERVRVIKEFMAFGLQMREIYTYAFFDDIFLQRIKWQPDDAVSVQNPVSVHWQKLVTSLIPNALQIVERNVHDGDSLRFFELARIWHNEKNPQEEKQLAAIFFEAKKELDFYAIKADISRLFSLLSLPVEWKPIAAPSVPWLTPHIAAEIIHNNTVIGTFGAVPNHFLHQIVPYGSAYVFTGNADILLSYRAPVKQFIPLPKYQLVDRDVSVIVPLRVTAHQLSKDIQLVDKRIISVVLIDYFEKESWTNKKALTFRYTIRDDTHSLSGDEIESIEYKVTDAMKQAGSEVR